MDKNIPWNDLVEDYLKGPEVLSLAVEALPDDKLNLTLDKNKWTIREIVHHIVEGDDLFVPFIKQALGGIGGQYQINWYWDLSQIEWGKRWGFGVRDIRPALALFKANREHTVSILGLIEDPNEYTLDISWPDGPSEEISIYDVVGIQVQHLPEHLEEIRKILGRSNK
ncbi:MAG: DinB family protein [Anaerolineales bacterium]|nr:MAG: DinB family protein [Anaerolineales bacterium]